MKNQPQLKEQILTLVQEVAASSNKSASERKLSDGTSLQMDLDFDSLMYMELMYQIKEQLGVDLAEDELMGIHTIDDLHDLIVQKDRFVESESIVSIRHYLENPEKYPKPQIPAYKEAVWKRTMLSIFYLWLKSYYTIEVRGKIERLPSLVFANHCSHLDTLLVMHSLGLEPKNTAILAAEDYFFDQNNYKFKMLSFLNIYPFSRQVSPTKVLVNLQRVKHALDLGMTVILFPEGTRSTTGNLLPFKSFIGMLAKEMNVDLLPLYIKGTYKAFPKGAKFPRPGKLEVNIGKATHVRNLLGDSEGSYQIITALLQEQIEKIKESA